MRQTSRITPRSASYLQMVLKYPRKSTDDESKTISSSEDDTPCYISVNYLDGTNF